MTCTDAGRCRTMGSVRACFLQLDAVPRSSERCCAPILIPELGVASASSPLPLRLGPDRKLLNFCVARVDLAAPTCEMTEAVKVMAIQWPGPASLRLTGLLRRPYRSRRELCALVS